MNALLTQMHAKQMNSDRLIISSFQLHVTVNTVGPKTLCVTRKLQWTEKVCRHTQATHEMLSRAVIQLSTYFRTILLYLSYATVAVQSVCK